jgi:RimJ/RimL family protein N-acetyltransferase
LSDLGRGPRKKKIYNSYTWAYTSWAVNIGEIGYSLSPAHRGQGLASEAVAALVGYALDQRGKDEVMAWTDTRNDASIALLQRLGFLLDPASRQRTLFKGAWCDEDRYVMTAQTWSQFSRISS